jgi:hypothetical protein
MAPPAKHKVNKGFWHSSKQSVNLQTAYIKAAMIKTPQNNGDQAINLQDKLTTKEISCQH